MVKKEQLEDEQYFTTTLTYHLAPVMNCDKASSILTFNKKRRGLYYLWDKYKYSFKMKTAMSFFELKRTDSIITVLFFMPCYIKTIIHNRRNREFLKKYGYEEYTSMQGYLNKLKERYEQQCPHDIGLFLGVPLQDVKSFIEFNGKNYLMCGYWKVYHELHKKIKIFNNYDKAKNRIVELVIKHQYKDILAS